jgi:predicted HTH transcriptional regulator
VEEALHCGPFINKHGKMNSGDVAAMFNTSRQAALKEIGKMVDLEIVKREGQASASYKDILFAKHFSRLL